MAHDEYFKDLLPAYALDCLDQDEMIRMTEHLSKCEVCQAELRVYQSVSDQLSFAVPQVDPSGVVKHKLMARMAGASEVASARPKGGWAQWLAPFQRLVPAWSLASLFLIVMLLISNAALWKRVSQNSPAGGQILRVINLTGTEVAPGATGLIVISLDGEHGTLVVDQLPVLGAENQYQLWLNKDGERTSGGIFSVSADGYGSLWVKSPQPLADYSSFGITIEPAGGSPGPTGERVLGGNL